MQPEGLHYALVQLQEEVGSSNYLVLKHNIYLILFFTFYLNCD